MPKLKQLSRSKSKGAVTPMYSKEDVFRMGEEYDDLSTQIKTLDTRKKELSAKIKEGATQFGVKDDKGSSYLENDDFILGSVCKKSYSLQQDKAIDILERLGLGDVINVQTIKVVDEDKLNRAVQEGRISLNQVEEFTSVNTSYSVSVKRKEPMAEVEQTTFKSAARRK